jgi:hypothetical protein
MVSIPFHNFKDGQGQDKIESVRVVLEGPQPPVRADTLCSPVKKLASLVASNLPG